MTPLISLKESLHVTFTFGCENDLYIYKLNPFYFNPTESIENGKFWL